MEYIDIFDDFNNPIGISKEKNQVHEDGDFHRTAHIWIINEKNESLSEALVREAKEEENITIEEKDVELAFVHHTVEDEYLNIYFTCKKYVGEPTIMEPDKCDDMSWFNVNQLPENTILKLRGVIKAVSQKINYDDTYFKRIDIEKIHE